MNTDKVFSDAVPFTFCEQLLERIEIDGEIYRVACLAPMVMQGARDTPQELPLWHFLCATQERQYRLFSDEASIQEYAPNWNRIPRVIEHLILYAPCPDSDTCVIEGYFSRNGDTAPSVVRSDIAKRISIEADVGFILLHHY